MHRYTFEITETRHISVYAKNFKIAVLLMKDEYEKLESEAVHRSIDLVGYNDKDVKGTVCVSV